MICLILHVNGVHTVKAIFKAFLSDNSRELFFCYSGHIEDTKSAESGSVAFSWRSNYIFTGRSKSVLLTTIVTFVLFLL